MHRVTEDTERRSEWKEPRQQLFAAEQAAGGLFHEAVGQQGRGDCRGERNRNARRVRKKRRGIERSGNHERMQEIEAVTRIAEQYEP